MTKDMTKPANPRKIAIAKNLVKFREAVGMTQAQASAAADVPIDNLRRYEQGATTPDALVLDQLGTIYGHEVGDFMQEEPPPARMTERPVFLLRTLPGVEVDEELRRKVESIIEKVNAEAREIAERKRPKKK